MLCIMYEASLSTANEINPSTFFPYTTCPKAPGRILSELVQLLETNELGEIQLCGFVMTPIAHMGTAASHNITPPPSTY